MQHNHIWSKRSREKSSSTSGPTTKRGAVGGQGRTTKEKELFLKLLKLKQKGPMTTKLEGGGGVG